MIKTRKHAGETRLYIDLHFRSRVTGQPERYRRDAQIQTARAAAQEERSVIAHFNTHGTIAALIAAPVVPAKLEPTLSITWEAAVKHYLEVGTAGIKPSTRIGYEALLDAPAFENWAKLPLSSIDMAHVMAWDARLADAMSDAARRNYHVALRSVLRCAVKTKKLAVMPDLPPLPSVGRKIIPSAHAKDVLRILSEDNSGLHKHFRIRRGLFQLAVALSSLGGLRAGEIRALRWADVDLEARTIVVRQARTNGIEAAPKSGHDREIPIARELHALLTHHFRCWLLVYATPPAWERIAGSQCILFGFAITSFCIGVAAFHARDIKS